METLSIGAGNGSQEIKKSGASSIILDIVLEDDIDLHDNDWGTIVSNVAHTPLNFSLNGSNENLPSGQLHKVFSKEITGDTVNISVENLTKEVYKNDLLPTFYNQEYDSRGAKIKIKPTAIFTSQSSQKSEFNGVIEHMRSVSFDPQENCDITMEGSIENLTVRQTMTIGDLPNTQTHSINNNPPSANFYIDTYTLRPSTLSIKRMLKKPLFGKFSFQSGVNGIPDTYEIQSGYSQIFVPKECLTSDEIYFKLEHAYLAAIEWSNVLRNTGDENIEPVADATCRLKNTTEYVDKLSIEDVLEQKEDKKKVAYAAIKYVIPSTSKHAKRLDFSVPEVEYDVFQRIKYIDWFDTVELYEKEFFPHAYCLENGLMTRIGLVKTSTNRSRYLSKDFYELESGDLSIIADNFFNASKMHVSNGKYYGYLNGLNRYFFEHNIKENHKFSVTSKGEEKYPSRLHFIEYTLPVNRVLEHFYGQMIYKNPTDIMREIVSPEASKRFSKKLGRKSRLYLIKYRCSREDSDALDKLSTYKTLSANNENELRERLNQILEEIKKFADYQDAKIVS